MKFCVSTRLLLGSFSSPLIEQPSDFIEEFFAEVWRKTEESPFKNRKSGYQPFNIILYCSISQYEIGISIRNEYFLKGIFMGDLKKYCPSTDKRLSVSGDFSCFQIERHWSPGS